MEKYINAVSDYKGSILAFGIMWMMVEKTTVIDVFIRLAIITMVGGEAGDLIQFTFDLGTRFETITTLAGNLIIWGVLAVIKGVLVCMKSKKCRAEVRASMFALRGKK